MFGGRPDRAAARCAAPIGSALAARLHPFGSRTTAHLVAMAPASARDVGTVVLERLVRELNGVACEAFKPVPEASKATAVTRPVWRAGDGPRRASRGDRAARGREDPSPRLVATWLVVFAHGRYRPNPLSASRQTRMSPPSNDPRIIAGLDDKLIEAMYQPGGVFTKCGVLLEELLPQGAGQGDVFAVQEPRARGLLAAMDGLNDQFGRGTVGNAAPGFGARAFDTKRKPKKPGMDDTLGGDPGRPLGRSRARQKKGEAEAPPFASADHLGDDR
jgi:DNA polymerase V